jgi:predicted  nucleic acid-binding Zn-ribbon protein
MSEIQVLLDLQNCDTQIMRSKRELDELPEVQAIMECRAKRKEVKAKQDQVVDLSDEVESKLSKLQKEEEKVIAKINALQEKLDTTSDYRVTNSVTRDMEGQVKRQGSIATEQDELLERQIKIDNLADQVADMLAKVDHAEEHHTEHFKQKGGEIKERVAQLEAEREALAAQLDASMLAKYEALRAEKGGVAVARLEEDLCTACRSIILEGELNKLRKGPDIAECPNCRRIIIVRDE